jgi:ABC-2 type transport system permease protein
MTAIQPTIDADTEARRRRRARPKPPLRSTLMAFLRTEFIEEISYPMTFVFTLMRSVMPLLLSFFIGQLIRDPRVGSDYLTFVSIGLGIASMLGGALSGFGGSLQRAFQRGTLETYLLEPVSWTTLPLAMNTWQLFLGIFNGIVLLVVGSMLGANYDLAHIPALVLLIVLGLIATTAIGVLSAAVLMLTLKSQPILHVYSLAAGLLAGSAFSVSQLPPWLRVFSWMIPHTYVINGSRSLLMTDPGSFVMPFSTAALVLAGFSLVFFPLGLWSYRRSLEFARKMGMLSGY